VARRLISVTPVLLWLERRAPAFMQDRLGRTGSAPRPLPGDRRRAQVIFKEDMNPAGADKFLFMLAPTIGFVASLLTYLVLPFAPK